ncbi:enoyl-CoA hydratase/isomerase family protein [Pseudonocardia sp. ICBG162]|uniref:enoyl-CoA hydratase/isomerase family protein n=1 Tax=Pseudonocardia sp. ICBG162 TaxID=2846761 RepID=UPI001CF70843|nr:enoyl-CoA hydratase-related protein [Pseudonocardia sp. ICBG162]
MTTDRTAPGEAAPAVLTDRPEPGILRITLNRPGSLNAMNTDLIEALHEQLRAVQEDSEVRAVVLTGVGRAFCAGIDLGGYGVPLQSPAEEEGRSQAGMRVQQHISSLGEAFRRVRAPIIGAVNGAAVGGGMALAVFCDIRLMARSAILEASFIRRGLGGTDIGLSWLLPRMIGFARATDIILTGRRVDAEEAERIGLVSAVVDDEVLQEAALERARLIAGHSPFGVWMSKEVLWANQEIGSFQAAVELENRSQILTALTRDHREAVTAFLEKRPAVFRNR